MKITERQYQQFVDLAKILRTSQADAEEKRINVSSQPGADGSYEIKSGQLMGVMSYASNSIEYILNSIADAEEKRINVSSQPGADGSYEIKSGQLMGVMSYVSNSIEYILNSIIDNN